jgi:hypothetical protein
MCNSCTGGLQRHISVTNKTAVAYLFRVPLFYCFTVVIHNYGLHSLDACCRWSNVCWESFVIAKTILHTSPSFHSGYCWKLYSIHLKFLTVCAVLRSQVPCVIYSWTQHKIRSFHMMVFNLSMQTFFKYGTLGIEINMAYVGVVQFDFCNNHIKRGSVLMACIAGCVCVCPPKNYM